MDWEAIGLSLRLAALSVGLLVPLGIALAWPLALGRFRGKVLLEAFTSLPLILPPTVLGFYILVALGPAALWGPPGSTSPASASSSASRGSSWPR